MRNYFRLLFALAMLLPVAWADEGMWTVNRFPKDAVKQRYGVQVTDSFLENVQLSAARFSSGGSGAFVSPNGLLFTNHHVGADCIQALSSAEHNYMAEGYYAAIPAEERACPDLSVDVLLKIEDVTGKVNAGNAAGTPVAEAERNRRANMARIEKACADETKNRCDVVTLYAGGRFDLYQFKSFRDIRLVFAPEASIAAFGGDPDNFTFPRYCFDLSFFRAYENGKPAAWPHYFRWSREGAKDGELTFLPGNPGATGRLLTMAQLENSRDVTYPLIQGMLDATVKTLLDYSAQSEEQKRVAREALLLAQNSQKAYRGFLIGLRDPKLMARKADEERKLRAFVNQDPTLSAKYGAAWEEIAKALDVYRGFFREEALFERYPAYKSELFDVARDVLRYAEETGKPNEKRLREYRESNLPQIERSMYSTATITDSLEIALIANYFRYAEQVLGKDNAVVREMLGGKSAEQAAAAYVNGSKLKDVEERKRLAHDAAAARESSDGMIRLVRLLDGPARAARKRSEDEVQSVITKNAGALAQARFAFGGEGMYPDATFTFRIEYGPVAGYKADGESIPWATVTSGLFRRATGVEPFQLPKRWLAAKSKLNPRTPFNYITTDDSHGGNSGSPTLNAKGEIIGIIFDGNLESLPNRFVYTDERARAVHVASQIIVEALKKVYGADRLLGELGTK